MLSKDQVGFYREHGYLILPRFLEREYLSQLTAVTEQFVARARGVTHENEIYDLEDDHAPECPRIRRLKDPDQHHAIYRDVLRSPTVTGILKYLLGPNVRLQNSKLNLKPPGNGAAVEWHQDWAWYPHTNDDVLALGIFLDDIDGENAPLMVVPGSHRGPVFDHHRGGVFVGAMDDRRDPIDPSEAIALTGPAGSISVHHVRLIHGSVRNRSRHSRRLLLYALRAADAWPLQGVSDLDEFNRLMICGSPTLEPRLEPVPVRIPLPRVPGNIFQVQKYRREQAPIRMAKCELPDTRPNMAFVSG